VSHQNLPAWFKNRQNDNQPAVDCCGSLLLPYTGCIEYRQLQARLLRDRVIALIPGGCCLIAVLNMTLKLIWDEPDRWSA